MPNPFHATYNLVAWTLDQDQIPSDVRRSLELVRTCDKDLQHLIELRNECLPRLERRPLVLARVHSIIESARSGLDEARAVVERCRPAGGRTPFSSRFSWMLVDSGEFRNLEPVLSRHHGAVLAELNFLRQIAMLAPVAEAEEDGKTICHVQKEAPVFDNVALLGDILGDLSVEAKPLPPIPQALSPPPVSLSQYQGYPSSSLTSPSRGIGLVPDSSAPEILPVRMNYSTPQMQSPATGYISEDMSGLANLLRDSLGPPDTPDIYAPPDRIRHPGELQTGGYHHPLYDGISETGRDRSQRASIGYTPSVSSFASQSPPPRASSVSTLPVYPYGSSITQHQNTSSTTLPARFNSPPSVSWQPIAELDSSPYQMVPVVRPASEAGYGGDDGKNPVVQFVRQLNTVPVELPAATTKSLLKTRPESRHSRTTSQPEFREQPVTQSLGVNQGSEGVVQPIGTNLSFSMQQPSGWSGGRG